jgi:amino acid adenylation domain-containing protein/thioester reductase-like protein
LLPALVHAQAKAHPDRTALVVGHERLTYAQLDSRVSGLAHHLRSQGVGRGALVGIYLDRTPDVVVALLAVLACGAAYTLAEADETVTGGVAYLARARPDAALSGPRHREALSRHGLRVLDVSLAGRAATAQRPLDVEEGGTAYVLYTSGSTGVPKGVVVSHANIRHYTESLLARLAITEPLSYAHVTTLAADLGNTCLFLALWTGGTLHLVADATRRDPVGLMRYLQVEHIDVVKTTPSHWGVVFRAYGQGAGTRPRLRYLLLGGELMAVPLARRVLASGVTGTLVNHYGPTEATVGVAAHVLTGESDLDALDGVASVPIGSALGATRLLVRDEDGRFHERAAIGELYITGPSVTLGYRDDAEATAAAYPDLGDVAPDLGRAYRTGDKVRADPEGVLEFLGRGDRQVKVGGYRVELGHVEAGLRRLPGVADAVVMHLTRDRPALVAAVVAEDTGTRPAELRHRLRDILPSYLVPERIEVFESFPCNSNGKADHVQLQRLTEDRLRRRTWRTLDVHDPVLADVCAAWQRHLGHGDFTMHDEFSAVGGGSVDAIQVIADLQAKGYQVSAATFLAEPTAAALAARLRAGRVADATVGGDRPPAARVAAEDTALSPAQAWFFRQHFAQPDHWNQALLLDVDAAVRPKELAAAVDDVLRLHPMLHTAFRAEPGGCRRTVVALRPAFTTSVLPPAEDLVARHIRDVAAARQAEIAIAQGVLFKAHLFLGARQAHLLLICHHLSTDAVSWRILANDLSRCYRERLRGNEPSTAPSAIDFGAWATQLRAREPALRDDLAYWDDLARFPALPAPVPASGEGGDNREGDAQAVWFRLSRAETDALLRVASASTGAPPHALLLAAFAQALAERQCLEELVVDVESHGRTSFDDAFDVSRLVGWFTSTFPIRAGIVAGDVGATGKVVGAALADVPHLGLAYGVHDQPRRTDVCFNYLGSFTLPYDDDLCLTLSRYPVAAVRGPDNDRGYGIKVTGRILDGQLVVDVSYTPRRYDPGQMLAVARDTRAHLLQAAGLALGDGQFVVEDGSTTGLLAQVPRALRGESPSAVTRHYGTVVLTGATGFIGAHLLHLLLTRTAGRIVCLVRERNSPAVDRLVDAYAWYLPDDRLDRYGDRLQVVPADVTEARFGLTEEDYAALCREVDAVYHLAADTRLFGDRDRFQRHNTDPVRRMIDFASTGRPKDLHYVSTLAVCGSGSGDAPATFSEDSLDIGQQFLNEYERSKYEAERLVHEFVAHGGAGFIYRTGTVAGHSVSGRFQRNGGDYRLVQLVHACVVVGRVPRVGTQTLALSPVDTVARGIFEISRSARVRGGTFHIDTQHEVSYDEIFSALRELGCVLADDDAPDFATLFGQYLSDSAEQVSLGHFWASRPDRNVRYDNTRSNRLLARLGVEFSAPDRAWLCRYFAGLIEHGDLRVPDWQQGVRHG